MINTPAASHPPHFQRLHHIAILSSDYARAKNPDDLPLELYEG
jgi:hypothetical protein